MSDTKDKILDAAEDLIQRVGVNAMSYQHISEVVGIRKASVHHHFPKKENLVEQLLERCQLSYGAGYSEIVNGPGTASEKLRSLAGVFQSGLENEKLCLVGSISTDRNTLQESCCDMLEKSINDTVALFSVVFKQGLAEESLEFEGAVEDAAYTFLSLLVGTQIVARSQGGVAQFQKAAKLFIQNFEK